MFEPKSKELKDQIVYVRVKQDLKQKLTDMAEQYELTTSELVRQIILEAVEGVSARKKKRL